MLQVAVSLNASVSKSTSECHHFVIFGSAKRLPYYLLSHSLSLCTAWMLITNSGWCYLRDPASLRVIYVVILFNSIPPCFVSQLIFVVQRHGTEIDSN